MHMYIGIIAEWNPFHRGHLSLIRQVRERCGNAPVVSVMSGAFVQRGEPALFDKWTRARWAVRGGADAVIELPVRIVLQSADRFADGSVCLLGSLGCTHIAFGTESAEASDLEEASAWTETEIFSHDFLECLKSGLSYADSVTQAMKNHRPGLADALTEPNNMLGFQYVSAIRRRRLPLSVITVRRDAAHPVSATAMREMICSGRMPSSGWPGFSASEAVSLVQSGRYTDYRRYEDACLLTGRQKNAAELGGTGLFSEGLENRWARCMEAPSYPEALSRIKSRRYLFSRLKRTGACLLLGISGQAGQKGPVPCPGYARLLALRRTSSPVLRESRIPVIVRPARARHVLDPENLRSLLDDLRASDMQSFCFHGGPFRRGGEDYIHPPEIIE